MEITLEALLASREARWHRQIGLIREHPSQTLVCLTVVMPGSVKRDSRSLAVAEAATQALKEAFDGTISHFSVCDLPTGYEAYLLTALPTAEAKRTTCRIEESHPLGRLFDLDVIDREAVPVTRGSVGFEPRKCLLCDREARYCMRNRTHTQEELLARIDRMIDDYVHRL